ncbi:hypothetical protein Val02_85410 [Virgisporangium aliadipatigenens]|uniref:Uncharacterized protein n=2 Tax=Virgisporangium aliadipatigenens TaxID=741659 RepID=A0A8J4DUU4_9ACTN|nr:hypothetical protein Val02_85410 [Virgisporangium aliadipatigenens]
MRLALRHLLMRYRTGDERVDREVFARHTIPRSPLGRRDITLLTYMPASAWDPRPEHVGRLNYRICDLCRLGTIFKIHTSEVWKRRGYASWMLDRSRHFAPDFTWITSRQLHDARAFWQHVRTRVSLQYTPRRPCEHIEAALRATKDDWRAASKP